MPIEVSSHEKLLSARDGQNLPKTRLLLLVQTYLQSLSSNNIHRRPSHDQLNRHQPITDSLSLDPHHIILPLLDPDKNITCDSFHEKPSPFVEERKTGFQESTSGVRSYFPKDVEGFKQNPHAQNGNFSSGYGSLSSQSSDFGSRKDYQSTLVDNRNYSSYSGGNASNLLRSSWFEEGLEAQPSHRGVYGQYHQNGNGYDGGYVLDI
ncbi:hypothetical protein FXO38_21267 [Capsicum annuum]|nr:hypothetical protein FXO38_21267 [Capsicum annuum]